MKPRKDLLEFLNKNNTLVIAEGVLFEFVRRGQIRAGSLVPEVVIDNPEAVRALHQEFCDAGSDVVQAFTYYANRKKMKDIGRENDLEEINKVALRIAQEVARKNDKFFAGGLCNSNIYDPEDPQSVDLCEAMFDEQCRWAKDAGVDYMIAETFWDYGEASLALKVLKKYDLVSVVSLCPGGRDGMTTLDGVPTHEALQRLEAEGADVVTLNCQRGPKTMIPVIEKCRAMVKGPLGCLPVCFRTNDQKPTFSRFTYLDSEESCYPDDMNMYLTSHEEIKWFAQRCKDLGLQYVGLCCGNDPNYMRTLALEFGKSCKYSRYSQDKQSNSLVSQKNSASKRSLYNFTMT